MAYPNSIDSFPPVSTGGTITATNENAQSTAIIAIETTLGTNPQLGYTTVAAALGTLANGAGLFLVKNYT